MLTCREMSELGSAIIEGDLRLSTRWAVFMHLRMCSRCTLYIKQLKLTSEVLQKLPLTDENVDTQAILKKLNNPEQ
ncbi:MULTISPECIES: zf-HC2 domain-containing protein [Pseudomonas]|uniref:zf-HC2 domain-containing protein n=1 Tax=Pseudomonas TaxID=286 RepID=UPI00106DA439|nr:MULTISPECIES: zf-HC2 domain-containing protein [Pseudomonas]NMY52290.1 zf-HC2 domain-containing protein [Pseudomonas sp. WS 5011]